jgi:YaiO family outer membrane protein
MAWSVSSVSGRLRFALILAAILGPVPAFAQSGWSVDLAGERSSVTLGATDTTWSSQTVTAAFTWPRAGWHAAVERQQRGSSSDVAFSTGGYRRLGDWTIVGGASASPDASFWFRRSGDVELARRVVGTLVASAGYRVMDFAAATIHQVQPTLTWYNPRGEVQARVYVTRNATLHRTSSAVLLRTSTQVSSRLTLTGAVAAGDRIFDVASLATGSAHSWTARAAARVAITPRDSFEIGGGYAREKPTFRQRTFALSYRRAF